MIPADGGARPPKKSLAGPDMLRRIPIGFVASILLPLCASCALTSHAPAEPAAEGTPRVAVSSDGVRIAYRVYGRGEPALVFVHGWSCDSSYWQAQVEEFRRKYTVVTVDLAGHGASGRNRRDWSMQRYGADVVAAARRLPNRKIVLIGHSMGGPVALEAAGALRERLLGIIGLDTFQNIGLPPAPESEALIGRMRQDFAGTVRSFVTESMFARDADPQLVTRIATDMSLAPPAVAIPSVIALLAMDYRPALAAIAVPIVALNAMGGQPTDVERIRRLAPTFRAVMVPDLGHFLMMEDPPRVNALLQKEIEGLVAP